MPSGLESLHKALKDEKRRKIITLLNEKGSLSYTDLMNALEIANTGKLNYHLKVLQELVTKNQDGLYILTDRGKLAAGFLQDLGKTKSPSQMDAPFPKGYLIVASLFTLAVVASDFAVFLLGSISVTEFAEYLFTAFLAFVFLVGAEKARVKRSMWRPNRQMLAAMLSIIFAGAFGGAVVLFFGGGLVMVALAQVGVHSPFPTFNSWIIASFFVGAVGGAAVGYFIFCRSRFSDPAYFEPF
jgi:hypothetical protein